jgi:hypothetical protein
MIIHSVADNHRLHLKFLVTAEVIFAVSFQRFKISNDLIFRNPMF